jgi:dTMP kinase
MLTREPGGTQVGEEIRSALLHGGDVPPRTELLLMVAARAALVDQVIRPALARGEIVISDRYELSSYAYQGYGRGVPLEEVRRVNAFATGGLKPDLTVLLDVEPEEGVARRHRAGAGADRIERAGDEFHREVARAYRLLSETEAGVAVVAADAAPESVHAMIRELLHKRYPETFATAQG